VYTEEKRDDHIEFREFINYISFLDHLANVS